jgi:hypothetical protein
MYPVFVTTGIGGIGLTVTGKFGDTVPFPQELVPRTVMLPETAEGLKLTVMELVFPPLTMLAPAGTVQE